MEFDANPVVIQTYFSGGVDCDGCCCDANPYRCCDALNRISCFSSTTPTAMHRTIRFGVVAHPAIDCSYRATPSSPLISDVPRSFALGCLRCPNRIRCGDAVNGVADAYDAANVQIHVTIHSHCPMCGDCDDVVFTENNKYLNCEHKNAN